jgi:hypothetical protein
MVITSKGFSMNETREPVRIYVGAAESEQLAFRVLEHSIKRHTGLEVEMRTIDNSLAAAPSDVRYLPYTNFSYGRFAIPKLAGYQGRAIYMDSDMIVFRDIGELWSTPFNGAKILVEETNPATDKGKITAVMLMDCAALTWDPDEIVAGLGARYDYNELMSMAPLLSAGMLQDRLPVGWNALDYIDENTRLLHYTKVRTQPWVYTDHPLGYLWVDEIRMMLDSGVLEPGYIQQQVKQKFIRPSLLLELGITELDKGTLSPQEMARYDMSRGFIIQQQLYERKLARRLAKLEHQRQTDPVGFARERRKRRWRKLIRHPLRFLTDPMMRV